jgi:hypothetical protein
MTSTQAKLWKTLQKNYEASRIKSVLRKQKGVKELSIKRKLLDRQRKQSGFTIFYRHKEVK